jgi:hypothetical protein
VLLPDALPADLLARWRALTEHWEIEAVSGHRDGKPLRGACVIETSEGAQLVRLDDLIAIEPDATLELLACPAMMAVSRELCGRGTVPLQLDVLFKHANRHSVILWHQGAPHPRGWPYLNVGIYLDDAGAGDGCVRYVPGTQHDLQDICALSQSYGWDIPETKEQPARAGDILVQDMMILHGSPPKRSPGVRRTIYVELRPVAGIQESRAQSARWAALRERWMGLVVRRAKPEDWPRAWREDLPAELDDDETELAAIVEHREPPIPAVYCPQLVAGPDYPIPSHASDRKPETPNG